MQKKKGKFSLFGGNQKNSSSTAVADNPALNTNFKDPLSDYLVADGVLKKYNGDDVQVRIPVELGITSIGQKAFFRRTDIKAIIVPESVTSIANYAFAGCENLDTISLPENLDFIGNYAFENCKSIHQVTLPDKLNSVGSYLFSGCSSLLNVHLPSELKTVGNYMFHKCESLQTITIPNKVTSIGWKAFSGCSSLVEVIFPNVLNNIGNYAFENCFKLDSISLSANITALGEGVFFMCKNLQKINLDDSNATYKLINDVLYSYDGDTVYACPAKAPINNGNYIIPEGVKNIAYGAFSSCLNLVNVVLPSTIENIDHCAFFNCMNLRTINLTDSIRTLGKNVFHNCCSLEDITIPSSLVAIEPGTFSGCENLRRVVMPDTIRTIGEIAFFGCVNLENFNFPESLNVIGCAAFTNCQKLNEITIHKNIVNIAKGAFSHCNSLTTINVTPDNMTYSSFDGVLYSKNQAYLLVYPAGKQDVSFQIPANVEYINDQAFYGVVYLQELMIPSSIQDIGISAFSEMLSLNKVIIEEGIKNIGTFVFSNNKNLSVVSIPKSVVSIDSSAFAECSNVSFICSTDSFAYKFASIKNIPMYSEKQNNFVTQEDANNINSEIQEPIQDVIEEPTIEETVVDEPIIDEPIVNDPINNFVTSDEINTTDINDTVDSIQPIDDMVDNTSDDNDGFTINSNVDNSFMSNESELFNDIQKPNASYGFEENTDYTYNYGNNTYSGESSYGMDDFGENIYNNVTIEPPLEDVQEETYENTLNSMTNLNDSDFRKDRRFDMPNIDGGIQPEYSSPNKIQNVVVQQNSTNSVILSWDAYPGAKEYHLLHFNTKAKMYDDISKIKSTKTLLTGIIPSHTQQYKLVAYGFEKYQRVLLASSRSLSISTSLPPVTGLESISSTNDSLSFSWDEVHDAVKYIVYAYNSMKRTFVPVDECVENFITLSNLVGISSLRVKVAAVKIIHNNECITTLSDEVIAYTTIESVSGITLTGCTSTSLKLNWSPISCVNAYKVYIYNPYTDKFDYADTTPFNQIVFNNLMPSSEYKFKIRACIITEEREVMGPPSSIFKAVTAQPEF